MQIDWRLPAVWVCVQNRCSGCRNSCQTNCTPKFPIINIVHVSSGSMPPPAASGDVGIFGGGKNSELNALLANIEYVTISTESNAVNFGNLLDSRNHIGALSNGPGDIGLFAGGCDNYANHTPIISYVTISTPGDALVFGDLPAQMSGPAGTSNGLNDRGLFIAGCNTLTHISSIFHVMISVPSDAQPFGELVVGRNHHDATSNDINERGIVGAGFDSQNTLLQKSIEHFDISTPSSAQLFGDLTVARNHVAATSNGVNDRGVFMGGCQQRYEAHVNTIEYVTISTPSNSIYFGDLSQYTAGPASTSNKIRERGVIAGGCIRSVIHTSNIEYITISTPSNATQFGSLNFGRIHHDATSNA